MSPAAPHYRCSQLGGMAGVVELAIVLGSSRRDAEEVHPEDGQMVKAPLW